MEELKDKRLLLLGGSMWKKQIKEFADDNGIVLIATGNSDKAGIFEIANETYNIDSTDAEAMKTLIKEKNIDGVYLGGSEVVISHACSYLSELGLPCYTTKEQWLALQNKANLKKLYIANGLPVVPEYEIDENNIESFDIEYPVITKPVDGSGSNGFSVCHNLQELKSGYNMAKSESFSGNVIVEKFVPNDSIVVIGRISNGCFKVLTVEDKYPVKYENKGSYVLGMCLLESKTKEFFAKKYEKNIANMLKSLGITEGPIWFEVFTDGKKFYFNEAGFRYGGSITIWPVQYFTGINEVAADIYYALTGKSKTNGFDSIISNPVNNDKQYCIYSLHLKPGIIKEIDGIDEIEKLDNIIAIPTSRKIEDSIPDSGSIYQVFGFVHFLYNDPDELRDMIKKIHDTIHFTDENGDEMLSKMIDIEHITLR